MKTNSTNLIYRYQALLGCLCIWFMASCSVVPKATNDVYIRMANNSEYELLDVLIGRRIIKKDSYSNTNYVVLFKRIPSGETSDYVNTRGNHLAFSLLRFSYKSNFRRETVWGPIQDLVKQEGGFLDTFPHPYTGQTLSGYMLDKGYYTFSFSGSSDTPVFTLDRDR